MNYQSLKISVVTPVFNREDCIVRCIDSVIRQDYPFVEMWIVDDGSTDRTSDIIREYTEKYEFIHYHKFETNRGANAARNYAIKNSTGDYIVFLDSDDYFEDNALCAISKTIEKTPSYNHYIFTVDYMLSSYSENKLLNNNNVELSFPMFLLGQLDGDFSNVVKAEIMKKYPFREDVRIYEACNWLQIYKDSFRIFFNRTVVVKVELGRIDSVKSEYRLSDNMAINRKYSMLIAQLQLFKDDYQAYDKTGDVVYVIIKEAYLLGLADGANDLSSLDDYLKFWNKKIPLIYRVLYRAKLGRFIRFSIKIYSTLKNRWK